MRVLPTISLRGIRPKSNVGVACSESGCCWRRPWEFANLNCLENSPDTDFSFSSDTFEDSTPSKSWMHMLEKIPTIAIIDDDDSLRRALARLLTASGYQVRTFASATEFLAERLPIEANTGCLLTDIQMPSLGGL